MNDEEEEDEEGVGEAVVKLVMEEEAGEESASLRELERDQTAPLPRRRLLRLALTGTRASVERLPAAVAVLESDGAGALEPGEEYFD